MKKFKIRLVNPKEDTVHTSTVETLTFAEAHVMANRLKMKTSNPYDWKIDSIQEVTV